MNEKVSNNKNSRNNNGDDQVTIYIDDAAYQVDKNNNLLSGVLSNKLNLPYFCWHPSMGAVGACRQCAVTQYQDENDTRGRMIMSCMTPVTHGMRIGLQDKSSIKFREQVITAMMINHPHDCPVCAEGGECHLQDMTVMTGHTERKYQGKKRTFTNQYLGELVGHEMNRCITCYRCVRFYKDYAGGEDFGVFGSKNQVYFGRQTDGVLESEFAGNLIEVCPTGVFTNKIFSSHYTRKWDLQSAPSVCNHCSIGCNTSIGERYGSVRRVMNRYNSNINSYFLCDRGRFGIGFVNASVRLRMSKGLGDNNVPLTELSVAQKLAHHRHERFIGIGSARASFEGNRLLKYLVGKENFSIGYTNAEMQLAAQHKQLLAQYPQPSLHSIEKLGNDQHDFILIIGEDVHQTAPRLALSLQQTLRNAGISKAAEIGIKPWQDPAVRTYAGKQLTPLFTLQAKATPFDRSAQKKLILTPTQLVQMVDVLIELLTQNVVFLDKTPTVSIDSIITSVFYNEVDKPLNKLLALFSMDILSALHKANNPLIICGLSLQSPQLLSAVNRLMACLASEKLNFNSELFIVAPQCNSVGNLYLLNEQSLSIEQVLERLQDGQADSIILLEQDLLGATELQRSQLRQLSNTFIVLDHSENALSTFADIVIPVAAVSESEGHFVNYQGVMQAFYPVHLATHPIMYNWRWLSLISKTLLGQKSLNFNSMDQLHHFFADLGEPWAVQILQLSNQDTVYGDKGVARQPHRASGRTAMLANQTMHEPKSCQDDEPNYTYSMEGLTPNGRQNMPYTWAAGWNSNQSILHYQQQINGDLVQQNNPNWLMFSFDETLLDLWQAKNDSENFTAKNQSDLIFIQNLPWFLVDHQARVIPEFILMFTGNTLTISAVLADDNHWQNGEVITATVNSITTFAQVIIDATLPSNIVVGCIFELNNNDTNCVVILQQATTDEIEQFKAFQQQRCLQAEHEKQQILARLKLSDQHIPIHLTSGGLNDA